MQHTSPAPQSQPTNNLIGHALILILLAAMCLIIASGCLKVNTAVPVASTTSFNTIKAPASFKWDTYRQITVHIAALTTNSNFYEKLMLQTADGQPLTSIHTLLSQSHNLQVQVPASATQLKIACGNIAKTIDIVNNEVFFNYHTPIPAQYE
jgi:hypothetical protein